MFARCGLLAIALAPALLYSAEVALAQATTPWDGTWTGLIGRFPNERSPIAVTISQEKVVSYTIKGSPFDIQYSSVNPAIVRFGDRDNYAVKLTRTGENTATARVHGRHGYGNANLTRQ